MTDRLKSAGLPLNDKNIVRSLLKMLQPTHGYHWSALEASKGVNEWIESHPELIWPMLLRAETWFELRNQVSNNWGVTKAAVSKLKQTIFFHLLFLLKNGSCSCLEKLLIMIFQKQKGLKLSPFIFNALF